MALSTGIRSLFGLSTLFLQCALIALGILFMCVYRSCIIAYGNLLRARLYSALASPDCRPAWNRWQKRTLIRSVSMLGIDLD